MRRIVQPKKCKGFFYPDRLRVSLASWVDWKLQGTQPSKPEFFGWGIFQHGWIGCRWIISLVDASFVLVLRHLITYNLIDLNLAMSEGGIVYLGTSVSIQDSASGTSPPSSESTTNQRRRTPRKKCTPFCFRSWCCTPTPTKQHNSSIASTLIFWRRTRFLRKRWRPLSLKFNRSWVSGKSMTMTTMDRSFRNQMKRRNTTPLPLILKKSRFLKFPKNGPTSTLIVPLTATTPSTGASDGLLHL